MFQVLTEDTKMDGPGDIKIIGTTQNPKKVGQSKFYDLTPCVVSTEKQDVMKPDDYGDDGNYIVITGWRHVRDMSGKCE